MTTHIEAFLADNFAQIQELLDRPDETFDPSAFNQNYKLSKKDLQTIVSGICYALRGADFSSSSRHGLKTAHDQVAGSPSWNRFLKATVAFNERKRRHYEWLRKSSLSKRPGEESKLDNTQGRTRA